MSLKFYDAYMTSLAKDPVSDWREVTQQMINDTWLDTSTIEEVDGQSYIGAKTFIKESVQWNSVLDPKTGTSLGDDYRKIIYKNLFDSELPPDILLSTQELLSCIQGIELYKFTNIKGIPYLVRNSRRFLGKYYRFNNYTWLTINTNTTIGSSSTAILQRCNNSLKWYDKTGVLHEWPCVFERKLSSTQFDLGSEGVAEVEATTLIKVQRNSETQGIEYNQRFIFNGRAFQVNQINNHISDTYLELYAFETQIQSNDDLINNIANNIGSVNKGTTETKILPDTNIINQGETIVFSVYRYIKGLISQDVFDVSVIGPIENVNYKLTKVDDNNFNIENLLQSETPMTIICTNKSDPNDIATKNILLSGVW